MEPPGPIIVIDLFPAILDELLQLLRNLPEGDWERPTTCASWSVKDVALHLLGVDMGILSIQRDGFQSTGSVQDWDELVTLVNALNAQWVSAARRISPCLLCDLLAFTGAQVHAYYLSLDPHAIGDPVHWAGPDPAPIWLDLAREYTEWWHHQQHIRDAVGRPGLRAPRFFAPVLDAFVRALPNAYRGVGAVDGALVALTISGESGGRWILSREGDCWNLYTGVAQAPDAEVMMDEDVAWRVFTRGVSRNEALPQVRIEGDRSLGLKVLDTASIIA